MCHLRMTPVLISEFKLLDHRKTTSNPESLRDNDQSIIKTLNFTLIDVEKTNQIK